MIKGCFLLKHNNLNVRMRSRSGGAFVASSDVILNDNGCVFGCILDNDMKVRHRLAENCDERNKMCGSKYVQSALDDTFSDVEKKLQNGQKVIFSGTACQVDALTHYLKSKSISLDLLVTEDIVCHGVFTPMLFDKYISYQEKHLNAKLNDFNFRDKEGCGWESHTESFKMNDKKKYSTVFTKLFQTDMALRPSCHSCPYASLDRPADITLADAWGIGKNNPKFHDNRGVSLVLVNSDKGYDLFEKAMHEATVLPVDIKDYMQPNLKRPSQPRGERVSFWNRYFQNGFDFIVAQYAQITFPKRLKKAVKQTVRKIIKGRGFYLPLRW